MNIINLQKYTGVVPGEIEILLDLYSKVQTSAIKNSILTDIEKACRKHAENFPIMKEKLKHDKIAKVTKAEQMFYDFLLKELSTQ